MSDAAVSIDIIESTQELNLPVRGALVCLEEIVRAQEIPFQQGMPDLNHSAMPAGMRTYTPQKWIPREAMQIQKASSGSKKSGSLHERDALTIELSAWITK